MKSIVFVFAVSMLSLISVKSSMAHCEVPCGIYQDELRVALIKEHIQTIEKAMTKIAELQQAEVIDYNQLVRWINTKEDHATKIQHIAEQYFLTQRVKSVSAEDKEKHDKYVAQLSSLHQLIVYAMKAKQGIDKANIEKMTKSLGLFETAYFGAHRHAVEAPHK